MANNQDNQQNQQQTQQQGQQQPQAQNQNNNDPITLIDNNIDWNAAKPSHDDGFIKGSEEAWKKKK